jgi:simple sugar transport system substrate-binding protein
VKHSLSISLLLIVAMSAAASGAAEDTGPGGTGFSVGVFVPGFVEGSPTYEMLVSGAERAVGEAPGATITITEAGYNQAEWLEKLTAFAATGQYDLIVTSNPAMPALCAEVGQSFPEQRFVVIDGYLPGTPRIRTTLFNQVEQAYLVGYMAGLVTTSGMAGANPLLRAGMVVGQEYPIMNDAIVPGFERGLQAAAPGSELDVRVVGNWYDAAKAAELAAGIFEGGADVILTIAGGANQGVVRAAKERGKYVLWFDSNGYSVEPGVVVGSSVVAHDEATYRAVSAALKGTLSYGDAEILGARDGFVRFIDDDPLYRQSVPETIRKRMADEAQQVRLGKVKLSMPEL